MIEESTQTPKELSEELGKELFKAIMIGFSSEESKNLIAQGADVNYTSPSDHNTCLTMAALRGNAEVTTLLIEKGAKDTANLDGDTALSLAVKFKKMEVKEILVQNGFSTIPANAHRAFHAYVQSDDISDDRKDFVIGALRENQNFDDVKDNILRNSKEYKDTELVTDLLDSLEKYSPNIRATILHNAINPHAVPSSSVKSNISSFERLSDDLEDSLSL